MLGSGRAGWLKSHAKKDVKENPVPGSPKNCLSCHLDTSITFEIICDLKVILMMNQGTGQS